jgi:PIN domain nuclease of toxin-antitoxin system
LIVLDSWALLAYMKDEPAAERIQSEWMARGAAISSVNLGEILYLRIRGDGEEQAGGEVEEVRSLLTVVDPDWPAVATAATIKASGGLAYADAFCMSAGLQLGAPIWTGDPEIIERAEEYDCPVVDLR